MPLGDSLRRDPRPAARPSRSPLPLRRVAKPALRRRCWRPRRRLGFADHRWADWSSTGFH